ncbi:unnamed protein product [Alopecurus aequalis]
MSGSYSSRLRAGAGGGLGATTLLAAKVAFASAALAAAASLARVALPQLVSGADAFLSKLFLFVTIHVIIFVIWKLSDNKHFHAPAHKDPWAPTPHHPAPPLLTEELVLSTLKRKVEFAPVGATAEVNRVPPPVSRPHIPDDACPMDEGVVSPGSCGGESCVTTESEEDYASAAYFAAADSRRSVAPAPIRERAVVDRAVSLPPTPAMAATDEHLDGADHEDADNDDDLDATWNAIMQKTRPATAPARPRVPEQASRRSARRS